MILSGVTLNYVCNALHLEGELF